MGPHTFKVSDFIWAHLYRFLGIKVNKVSEVAPKTHTIILTTSRHIILFTYGPSKNVFGLRCLEARIDRLGRMP